MGETTNPDQNDSEIPVSPIHDEPTAGEELAKAAGQVGKVAGKAAVGAVAGLGALIGGIAFVAVMLSGAYWDWDWNPPELVSDIIISALWVAIPVGIYYWFKSRLPG